MAISSSIRPTPSIPRRTVLAAGLGATLLTLAACSSSPSAGSSTGPSAQGSTGASGGEPAPTSSAAQGAESTVPTALEDGLGSGQADGVFPRTVTHHQGDTQIAAEPTRVVVVSTGQADAMLTLGLCPVGSTTASGAQGPVADYLRQAYPDQAGAIEAITPVGSRTEPDIEAIAALSPDLILTNVADKDDAQTLYDNLSAIAPTVSMRGTGQYWKVDFLLLADALGRREQAQGVLDSIAQEASERGSTLEPTTTVSLLRRNGDKLRVFGPLSFAGSVVADLGLARPDTQRFTDDVSQGISSENLDVADGDWLFYGVQGGDETELTGEPLWDGLTAVAAGRAVEVDGDTFFLNAGPTAARTVLDQVASSLSA